MKIYNLKIFKENPGKRVVSRVFYYDLLTILFILTVYCITLAPTVYTLDSAEIATAAYSLGVMHAPGYVVHLLLLHLFLYLPVGDVGYRSNLFSAFATVGTVWLLLMLCRRIYQRCIPALVAGLSFGLCFYVWSVSVVAEVYTLQGCFLAALLLLLWSWRRSGKTAYLAGSAAIQGLALVNNPATALWWPGLLVIGLATPRRHGLTLRQVAVISGMFILALTPLLYLPVRSAETPEFVNVGAFDATGVFHPAELTNITGILAYLSGKQFEPLLFSHLVNNFGPEILKFLRWLVAAFLGIGFPLGLWGIWELWQHERSLTVGLLLIMGMHALFFISYGAFDKATMFLPVYLIWAVFIGAGVQMLNHTISPRAAELMLLLPVALLFFNAPFVNMRHAWEPAHTAQQRLASVPPSALYLARWGDADIMRYYQIVEDIRPDVDIVNVFFTSYDTQVYLINTALEQQRPVYVSFSDEALFPFFRFVTVDHGYRLAPRKSNPLFLDQNQE